MLTRGQKLKNQSSNHAPGTNHTSSSSNIPNDQGTSTSQIGKDKTPFDFIQFYEESKIQISPLDYLKSHPFELKRLVDHCKWDASDLNHNVTTEEGDEPLKSNLFNQEDSTILSTSPGQKHDPFYISLYINGCKLRNCIIDSGASDNVMPYFVSKALGLNLTKVRGRCYSMDAKQVPLLGQIKDAQVELTSHLEKKLLLTILVVDILARYGFLLSRIFCQDLGGEIKLDYSQVVIPIGSKKVKLEFEEKEKFVVLKLDDPKAQILYQELEFGNYMFFTEDALDEQRSEDLRKEILSKEKKINRYLDIRI